MNMFEKRPLCLILCIGLCGFLLFIFDTPIIRLGLILISILPCVISFFLKLSSRTTFLLRSSTVALLISFLLSFSYFDLYFNIYDHYEGEVKIIGIVEEISPGSASYSRRLLIRTESIDGKERSNALLYAYPSKADAAGIVEGTKISFTANLGGFSEESRFYNIGNGINAYANDIDDIEILEYTDGGMRGKFKLAREYLTRRAMMLSDGESGALLSALLLGEREYLPDQLRLDFKRIGISHILALSGLHLAILSLGFGKLLSLLKVKKKQRVLITSLIIILYMALTGFSVSVCRAGIMLIISSLLFLLGRSKDSMTSLSIAVFVICLFTPYAIFDISLWLSALATLGIIAFGEYSKSIEFPVTRKEKIKRYLIFGILTSVFAISGTNAISTFSFGGFSILAPIATLVFSFLVEIIMYLGCVMMAIGNIIPIGWIVSPLCKLVYSLAGAMSSIKFSYVSSDFPIAKFAIIIYTILFFLFLIIKLENRQRALKVLLVSFAIISILPTISTIKENYKETVAYYGSYRTDLFLIRSENEVCLINSAQYSKSTAYDALDLLDDSKSTFIDKYYLTHYSWSLCDDIETVLYNVSVDKIYLPKPRNDDEKIILKLIYKSVEKSNAEVVLFTEQDTVTNGEYSINLLYSEPYGDTSKNAVAISKRNTVYTYISSGLLIGKNEEKFKNYFAISDYVILGNHGKKYKNKVYISECYEDLDCLIMHSDNIFLKQENMLYYIEKECEILSHPEEIIHFLDK